MPATIALAALFLGFAQDTDARPAPLRGPLAVCFNYSSLDLAAGQRLEDFQAGTESMHARVRGPGAGYAIIESQLFGPPETPGDRGTLVATHGATRVYRLKDAKGTRYAIYGPAKFFGGEERKVVLLSGSAFTGGKGDAAIYSRFRIVDPDSAPCKHRFIYGWEAMSWDADPPAPDQGSAAASKAP